METQKSFPFEKNKKVALEYFKKNPVLELQTSMGNMQGLYYCGNHNYEISMKGITIDEVKEYKLLLAKYNFKEIYQHQIGNNLFYTFQYEKEYIHLCFYPNYQLCQLVFSNEWFHPLDAFKNLEETDRRNISLVQLGRKGATQRAPGMAYALSLGDGKWILIDGGPKEDSDVKKMLKLLKSTCKPKQKPTICLWMLSHYHSDHTYLAADFIERYHQEVNLEMVAYNFPDEKTLSLKYEKINPADFTRIDHLLDTYYPTTKKWIFHSGQKVQLYGLKIEILYTHEDYYPQEFFYGNDTCSAWMITTKEKKILFCTDCDPIPCEHLADNYGSFLKCDIMQLAHHGFNGATLKLYQLADPDICLWACDRYRFDYDGRCLGIYGETVDDGFSYSKLNDGQIWHDYFFNYWLRNDLVKRRKHYHSESDTILNL